MKKIAAAILRVNACQQEVEWASESVVDTSLTPAQVKAQVKQMLEAQLVAMEQQFDQRLKSERSEWTAQIQQLRDELEEERKHRKSIQSLISQRIELEERNQTEHTSQLIELQEEMRKERHAFKAFKAKVKDFSEEVWFLMCPGLENVGHQQHDVHVPSGRYHMIQCIRDMVFKTPIYMDPLGTRNNLLYKRAGITDADWPVDQADYQRGNKGELLRQRQLKATEKVTLTTFS